MRTGQVIGSTDRVRGHAKDRPVHFQEVFATLYHNLGIDPRTATVTDLTGRPQYLVDGARADPRIDLKIFFWLRGGGGGASNTAPTASRDAAATQSSPLCQRASDRILAPIPDLPSQPR